MKSKKIYNQKNKGHHALKDMVCKALVFRMLGNEEEQSNNTCTKVRGFHFRHNYEKPNFLGTKKSIDFWCPKIAKRFFGFHKRELL